MCKIRVTGSQHAYVLIVVDFARAFVSRNGLRHTNAPQRCFNSPQLPGLLTVLDSLFLTRGYAELVSFVIRRTPGVQQPSTSPPHKSSEACAVPSHQADNFCSRKDAATQAQSPLREQGRCASPTTPFLSYPPESTSKPMAEPSWISNIEGLLRTIESTRSTAMPTVGKDMYAASTSTAPMRALDRGGDAVLATGEQAVSTRTLHPTGGEHRRVAEVGIHQGGKAKAGLRPRGFSSATYLFEGDSTRTS